MLKKPTIFFHKNALFAPLHLYFYFFQKICFKKLYFLVVSILGKTTLSSFDIAIFPRRYFPHFTSTIKWYLSWSWQETILKIQIVVDQICSKNWKVWVEKRLSEIREKIQVDCWHYVPTECNAAYIATRCNKKVKFNETLWFKRKAKLPDIDFILSTLLRM